MTVGRRGFFRLLAGAVLAASSLPGLLIGRIKDVHWTRVQAVYYPDKGEVWLSFNSALAHSLESAALSRSWFDEGALVGPRGDRVIVTRVRPLTSEPDPAWRERA